MKKLDLQDMVSERGMAYLRRAEISLQSLCIFGIPYCRAVDNESWDYGQG